MSQDDYEEIARIIEDVIGKDTLAAIKILEGVKFYLDNKIERIRIIKEPYNTTVKATQDTKRSKEAEAAMRRYTQTLKKDTEKLKESGKYCGIKG